MGILLEESQGDIRPPTARRRAFFGAAIRTSVPYRFDEVDERVG
jgi:hypothetical protein